MRYKILIVDDSRLNRILLKKLLVEAGYEVLEAGDGRQGRELASSEQPHLILLDIQMPVEDGFEALGKLKVDSHTAQIPVIFLSGLSDVSSKVLGLESGAVDFITKPFDPDEVKARVKVHIKLNMGIKAVIENQREKIKQIENAQQQMLITPEEMPEAKFVARYQPFDDAGGDFYAVVALAEHLHGYFLGDVSGHDLSTSYITAALNALLKQNCTALNTPSEAMSMINRVLCQTLAPHKFLAASYLQINRATKRASFINMGNTPVVHINNKGESHIFVSKGAVLGMFEEVLFSEYEFPIEEGDRFVLFSDGILECAGTVWSANMDPLLEVGERITDISLDALPETFYNYFITDTTKIADDIAILALEV